MFTPASRPGRADLLGASQLVERETSPPMRLAPTTPIGPSGSRSSPRNAARNSAGIRSRDLAPAGLTEPHEDVAEVARDGGDRAGAT